MSAREAAIVDEILVIRAQIVAKQERLKSLEEELKAIVRANPQRHALLEDKEREGRQFLARGSAYRLPLVISADLLIKGFAKGSTDHGRIHAQAGEHFLDFFTPLPWFQTTIDDAQQFRARALKVFGAEQAPAFLTACVDRTKLGIPKNKISIAYDRASEIRASEIGGSE